MAEPPNLIWITLDSLRADHASLYGYSRDTTPNLERITGDGFTATCISHGIWTLPSSTSILTATYPSHHDVGFGSGRLTPEIETVAERFSRAGYRTACLSDNSHITEATDLDRGFDRFAWLSSSTLLETAGLKTTLAYAANVRRHSAGFTAGPAKHATPYILNAVTKRWLEDLSDEEPFFLYVHNNEPHRPYHPPLPYLDRYTDDLDVSPKEAVDISMQVHENLYEIVANGCELSETERAALHAMYDAEIAYTDEMIGRLYDHVLSMNLENTIFLVTADHGELFGEYGVLAHKLCLHDGLIRVPLAVGATDDVDLSLESDDLVQHADLMTTFLAAAGGDTKDMHGIDLRSESREFAISQRGEADFDPFLERNSTFKTARFHKDQLTCLRTNEYKYQSSGNRSELYALPNEETDISGDRPDVAADFEESLVEWMQAKGTPIDDSREAEFSDAMRQQLHDLGYLE